MKLDGCFGQHGVPIFDLRVAHSLQDGEVLPELKDGARFENFKDKVRNVSWEAVSGSKTSNAAADERYSGFDVFAVKLGNLHGFQALDDGAGGLFVGLDKELNNVEENQGTPAVLFIDRKELVGHLFLEFIGARVQEKILGPLQILDRNCVTIVKVCVVRLLDRFLIVDCEVVGQECN